MEHEVTGLDRYELRRSDPSLDEDEEAVRAAFARFFARECPPEAVRAAEPLGFDRALWERLVGLGITTMGLPEELGGDDATLASLVLIAEEWGRRVAPLPLASHVAATRLLGRTTVPANQPAGPLEAAKRGDRIYALALSPAVRGVPQLVPEAAVAAGVIALAGDQLTLFTAAAPATHAPNQGSTPLAWWQPDEAAETVTLASGPDASAAYELAVTEWKLLQAAALVGLAEAALLLGVEFAKTRETMGVPIGTLQGVAHPLADAAIEIAGARVLVRKAAWTLEREPGTRPELPLMAFDVARRAATLSTTTTVHVQGGLGFTVEADASLYFLRAKGWSALAGDPAADLTRIGARLVARVG